ncbi:MAG: alkylhydroperoxidase, partial [Nocardioides sp.]|nr:alkylhydroperoxidase [Nocardioides sp.]
MTTRISALTPATAKGTAQEMLTDLVARHGQVGSMVATMAHSPAVLGGYLQLSKAMKRAKLSRRVSELVSVAIQTQLSCQLC